MIEKDQAIAYALLTIRRCGYAEVKGNTVNDPDEEDFKHTMQALMNEYKGEEVLKLAKRRRV